MEDTSRQHAPSTASDHLRPLNLDIDVFDKVGSRGLEEYLGITALHPKGAGGSRLYLEVVPALRELTLVHGYEPRDVGGVCLSVNDNLQCALAVSSGDDHVGYETRLPSFRYPKGLSCQKLVAITTGQIDFFSHPAMSHLDRTYIGEAFAELAGYDLWWYLHFVDVARHQMRHELSLPGRIDDNGNVVSWQARVILAPVDFGMTTPSLGFDSPDPDTYDPFVVEVRKRR